MEGQSKGSRGLEAYCKGDQGPPRAVAASKKKEEEEEEEEEEEWAPELDWRFWRRQKCLARTEK
jgi:hypothetical protein